MNKFPSSFAAERLRTVFLVLTLVIVSIAVAAIWNAWNYPAGRLVEARVQRFGYIAGKLGDTPLITVRLPDGSQRQVLASRQFGRACKPGDKIALVQNGDAFSVGVRGCYE